MAKKATALLRLAVYHARAGDTASALALIGEAGDWAIKKGQPNLASWAARLWDELGGHPGTSRAWRERCCEIRARHAAWRRW
jgi:hypothetical protein